MRVLKRNGEFQDISFDKVLVRLKHLSTKLNLDQNDIVTIAQKVCARIYDGVKTSELDKLAANLCISLSTEKIEYAKLASYLVISNHHKDTLNSFSDKVKLLYHNKNGNNEHSPLVSKALYKLVNKYGKKIDKEIDYNRDYDFDFFGFKTLERAYMLRTTEKIVERIQDIFMRVSLGLHGENIETAFKSYHLMSQKYFTHATPTLFHSGTERPQLLSCFLMGTDDSVEGMYKNITDCALIQKWAGGIGVHISNIRSSGSIIASTNGKSNGIIPMLKVYNSLCKHINQSGKRQGSIAIYLEPHHPDILDFLELRKNHGNEDQRARDLFTAVWLSDLFMKKVEKDEDWCLFDPNECKGLSDCFGEEYEKLYNKYFEEKKYRKIIPARKIWRGIIDSQIETGTPYILFKDAANKKSNQQNLGTIKSSNLCAEILEYSDNKEYACCTLASIGLPKFVDTEQNEFDFKQLEEVVEILVQNLNNVIDINYYPVPETSRSNFRHRPIGIGVQGLADVFIMLDLEFDSAEAKKLNEEIFETIYYASMKQSCKIAKERKEIMLRNLEGYKTGQFHFAKNDMWCDNIIVPKTCPNDDVVRNDLKKIKIIKMEYDVNEKYLGAYQSFEGSPLSQGKFQFDLWGKEASKRYNWDELRKNITENGVRNSLAIALMPTASTSQILGNNECIEPYTSNIYSRRTIAGDFVVVNKHLIEKCNKLGIWTKEIKDKVIAYNGSVQYIDEIPENIKKLFRTAWELKQKSIMELAISRGPFVCQTQSMNLFFEEPTYKTLTGALFYAWREGLKTGVYYVRSRPKIQAQQFTLDPDFIKKVKEQEQKTFEVCESCSA